MVKYNCYSTYKMTEYIVKKDTVLLEIKQYIFIFLYISHENNKAGQVSTDNCIFDKYT